jgi:hypothetical protein
VDSTVVKVWRITAMTVFPNDFPVPADGTLPERLEPVSRVPEGHGVIGERAIRIRQVEPRVPTGTPPDIRFASAEVVFNVEAADTSLALEAATALLERLFESLSFQLQAALNIVSLDILDITPPVDVGDERELLTYPAGSGYPLLRFRPSSTQMQGVLTATVPDPTLDLSSLDDRSRAALDWYLKSLAAPYAVDQFIFSWIAAEILWSGSGVTVEGPYVAACGHTVAECPECGRETSRQIRGQSIRRYLVDRFGQPEDTARRLWKARQILHGAERFDSELMGMLDELIQALRVGVVAELKRVIGIDPHTPPIVGTGFSVAPHVALGGTRRVAEDDLSG